MKKHSLNSRFWSKLKMIMLYPIVFLGVMITVLFLYNSISNTFNNQEAFSYVFLIPLVFTIVYYLIFRYEKNVTFVSFDDQHLFLDYKEQSVFVPLENIKGFHTPSMLLRKRSSYWEIYFVDEKGSINMIGLNVDFNWNLRRLKKVLNEKGISPKVTGLYSDRFFSDWWWF
jgi:hypothetical protein